MLKSHPGYQLNQPCPAAGSTMPWWRPRATSTAVIVAKSVRPRQGSRASRDKNAGSTGVGGGAIAGEATGAAVLPGRGPTRPLGRRRHEICGVAATSSSGRGLGSAWATGLCWREAEPLAGTRPRALSEGVCRSIGNDGKRLRRGEDTARLDEGVAAEARRPTRVRQNTAANPSPDKSLLFQGDAASSSGQACMASTNILTLKIDSLCQRRPLHPI